MDHNSKRCISSEPDNPKQHMASEMQPSNPYSASRRIRSIAGSRMTGKREAQIDEWALSACEWSIMKREARRREKVNSRSWVHFVLELNKNNDWNRSYSFEEKSLNDYFDFNWIRLKSSNVIYEIRSLNERMILNYKTKMCFSNQWMTKWKIKS